MTDALETCREALALLRAKRAAPVAELSVALDQLEALLSSATDAQPQGAPEVMTVEDLADYLQVSKKAVYAMAKTGELPAAKVGDQWRFKKSLVDRWLTALSRQSYTGPNLPEGESQNGPM